MGRSQKRGLKGEKGWGALAPRGRRWFWGTLEEGHRAREGFVSGELCWGELWGGDLPGSLEPVFCACVHPLFFVCTDCCPESSICFLEYLKVFSDTKWTSRLTFMSLTGAVSTVRTFKSTCSHCCFTQCWVFRTWPSLPRSTWAGVAPSCQRRWGTL